MFRQIQVVKFGFFCGMIQKNKTWYEIAVSFIITEANSSTEKYQMVTNHTSEMKSHGISIPSIPICYVHFKNRNRKWLLSYGFLME